MDTENHISADAFSAPLKPKRFLATAIKDRNKDVFLQTIIAYVNDTRQKVDITLQMGGLLISGTMIAGDTYFNKFARIFYGNFEEYNPALKGDFEMMSSGGDRYRQERESPNDNFPNPMYIHLEDCRMISGNHVSKYSVLWRGRVSQVDGFFLGGFSPVKAKQDINNKNKQE